MLGGGNFFLTEKPWTRQPPDFWNIAPLVARQPYIRDVQLHRGEYISHNLDAFRSVGTKENNIAARHCWALGVPDDVINQQWLFGIDPLPRAKVIINRTARYQNPLFPWQEVVDKYRDVCAFVGTLAEYWKFTAQFGYVRRVKTESLLDVARVIAGAELFIGNQSCPAAIAEGFKKPLVLEVFLEMPNTMFERDDVIYCTDGSLTLPDL